MDTDTLKSQAALLGHYLIGRPITNRARALYVEALTTQEPKLRLSRQDQATLHFALKHRWALGLMDAGLSFLRPNAELRRRLFIMFSILEAQPEYCDDFLPQKQSKWQLLRLFFVGCRAGCKLVLGAVLVKVIAP